MKDDEFRKWYHVLIEWEPFPKEKARKLLERILAVLFGSGAQPLLKDQGKQKRDE